ncbi:ATP-grasp domain-containing protein [Halorussus lipolyticus]|uniref:ATP-grasp domain-containing protein n=1 Tax=Halorussus lipolyticus TaxID=3034024 RepID=UPI0023E88FEA|nr:hypothetical protein [Halorussus sp. DT80]
MTIVILGETDRFKEHELVREAAEERGAETVVVPVEDWPGDAPVEHTVGSGECVLGESIRFDDVTGVFSMIQTVFPTYLPHYDWFEEKPERPAYKQLREWQQTFRSLLAIFEEHGAKIPVSPRDRYWDFHRPWMLQLYDDEDVPVPDTTFTNDPERVEEFVENHSRALVQPVNGGEGMEVIRPDDLKPERLEKLSGAPIKLQEYIPGEDTRAYVVDGEFVGQIQYGYDEDAISFKSSEVAYTDIESIRLSPDADLRETIVRAAELTPSAYAAVDVRITDDGDYTVLESNTPGRFAAHDLAGATAVGERIAEYLLAS